MYIVIFTSLLALYLTFLDSRNIISGGMKWSFLLLTFLGCIHYDYGNDYLAYLDIFNDVTRYPLNIKNLLSGETFKEPGWAVLCYLFKYIGGFFMMVAVLNVVQNYLVYCCIKKFVSKSWWTISLLIYLLNDTFYLMNFSMMRQSFVICVFFGIWNLIVQRRIIISLLILYLCSTIHTSALILIPFAFFGYVPTRYGKTLAISFTFLYLIFFLSGALLNDVFSTFMQIEDFNNYAEYYDDHGANDSYGIGFLINNIPFVLSIYYLFVNKGVDDHNNRLAVMLCLFSFIIIPFASIVPLLGRVGAYFSIYQLIAIPIIYSNISDKQIRFCALFVFVFITVYGYYNFFHSPVWVDKFTTFKTIFPYIFT